VIDTVEYTIDVIDLRTCLKNPTIMGYLRAMTLHQNSGMSILLNEFIHGKHTGEGKSIIASIDGSPIAWSLFTTDKDDYNDISFDREAETYLQVFVKPEYRKLGIGSSLFLKGQELAANRSIGLSKHSPEAIAFFNKVLPQEFIL
jgi:GNAT superfamily N-acetyltransferase